MEKGQTQTVDKVGSSKWSSIIVCCGVSPSLKLKGLNQGEKRGVLTLSTMQVKLGHLFTVYLVVSTLMLLVHICKICINVYKCKCKCWLFHPQYSPRSSRRHIAHQALTVHSSSLLAIHPCPQNSPLLASEWDTCGRQYNRALKWKKYLSVCNGRHHACLSSSLSECVWFQIRLVPLSYLTICVFWCADVESIWNVSWLKWSAINPPNWPTSILDAPSVTWTAACHHNSMQHNFKAKRPLDQVLSDESCLILDRVLSGAHLTERSESQPASHCSYPLW